MTATPAHVSGATRQEQDHIRGLDGLRGLAVMLVVVHHVLSANSHTPSRFVNFMYAVFHAGWFGVDLFFVLSGFLITQILFSTQHDPHYLRSFYGRRMLRIFPLYYGVILLLVALEPWLHLHLWGVLPYYLTYTANLRPSGPVRAHDLSSAWILTHFWSLQVEEQFYLVWPFLLARLRTRRKIVVVALVGSVIAFLIRVAFTVNAVHLNDDSWAYAFTPCRMDSLLIGGALVMLWSTRFRPTLIRYAGPTLLAVILILSADAYVHHGFDNHGDGFISIIGYTLLALGSASLIVLVLSRKAIRSLFEGRVLCWLGKYSYGIYVLHFPINYLIEGPLRIHTLAITNSKLLAVVLPAALITLLSILAAFASYQLYEKRFLRLKRFFPYQRAVVFEQPAL